MIDYTYNDLFMDDSTSKQLVIEYDNTAITNEDLFNQTMTLEESLCSEDELRFGCCEASVLKFKVANIVAPMKGKWLSVKMVLNNHTDEPFIIGKYKVEEDKLTSDRMWREITAYDAMQDIINADGSEMAAWYNTILPDDNEDTWVTMRSFRISFLRHFGIEQETVTLINDYMKVERTIAPEQISGKDIITAICEINGCFGHIGRDGKFHWIYLQQTIQGLYPANDLYPADDLFPRDPKGERVGANGTYIDVKWENFVTKSINKIQIRQEENDIGKIYPDTPLSDSDNSYIIENNFLVYGKSSEELLPIAQNILNKIKGIEYRPMTDSDIKGNPCFEVGDPIRIETEYELVETYIFERTLKGIQALRDAYKSNGVEKYSEQVNGVHSSIIQLKGKTNILTRTIEETKSEITDIESGLNTKILQNSKEIQLEAKRAINSEVELAAAIKVTADNITAEVSRAQGQEVELAAAISVQANQIQLKVSKGNISSEISQEAGKISIKSDRFSLDSTNTKIKEDGTIECKNIKITGGSVQIETAYADYDFIKIKQTAESGNWSTVCEATLNGFGLECIASGKTTRYSGTGVYSDHLGTICKTEQGKFNQLYAFDSNNKIKINASAEITGAVTADTSLEVKSTLYAQSVTIKPLGNAQYTLKKDTVKTMSSVLGLSTKQLSIPAGYMFSSNVTFTYNATVNGYVLTTFPMLTQVAANSGYAFANNVTFSDKNVVGY